MGAIAIDHVATAARRVRAMTLDERARLADEVHALQPNLLYSVLVLKNFGVTLVQMEVVINLLLDSYEAMKACGRRWPLIDETVQDRCLARISARVRFSEGLTPAQHSQIVGQAVGDHKEPALLAHVLGKLKRQGLFPIGTDAEKYLVLAALNLVECIAETAPTTAEQTRTVPTAAIERSP